MTLSLLVATPQLAGSLFERSVLLMLDQADGALGLVINQPAGFSLSDLLPGRSPPDRGAAGRGLSAYSGGPVERSSGWCLYAAPEGTAGKSAGHDQSTEHELAPGLWLSRDREVLDHLMGGDAPFYLLLGYAGWASGQLEREAREGAWLWGEIEAAHLETLLWHTPDEGKWQAALALLGTPPQNVVGGARA
ncbi:YqgE/AlgH family protein [Deinococcus sp.]|uniref:YqgE/AlgH family protein n=1 Tax=Deinococcus sp. TaxID=47478 RepID=UPI0025F6A464|nr:YqgE/AlgH family protein [Deinococcus sp.]